MALLRLPRRPRQLRRLPEVLRAVKVLNRHHLPGKRIDPETQVYVGRGTPVGNPFIVGKPVPWTYGEGEIVRDRDHAVALYREWFYDRRRAPQRAWAIAKCLGKDLVCSCAPLRCHADVILEFLRAEHAELVGASPSL